MMPRYRCHKEVFALKIADIVLNRPIFFHPTCKGSYALDSACGHCERCTWERDHHAAEYLLLCDAPGHPPIHVNAGYIQKHNPKVGGYYVVYDDGYQSFSPAKAFEEGYTLIG